MNRTLLISATLLLAAGCSDAPIDRRALVERNSPHVERLNTLASLTVGNGGFAFTVDATGLQTFPEYYAQGVPLGTQSDWGWHSFANPEHYRHEESLRDYDFGRGRMEPYATQPKEGRGAGAANWYRINPHRLHLGTIGFDGLETSDVTAIDQHLDLWEGRIRSAFTVGGDRVEVSTVCDPQVDRVAARIRSARRLPVVVRFAYPTGGHSDDACDWSLDELHTTELISSDAGCATLRRTIDSTVYYVCLNWEGEASIVQKSANAFVLTPAADEWALAACFTPDPAVAGVAPTACAANGEEPAEDEDEPIVAETADNEPVAPEELPVADIEARAAAYWTKFWSEGGVVDFSRATDPRAAELERRVVLSQYLLAVQCAGDNPPQETGLTYNSWFGKFHLEMIYWHQAQFALWGHADLLERTLGWYRSAAPVAREIARRQGFEGLRWMKMTDPSAMEAPSKTGSFLIWQQPHLIYLAELVYRAKPSQEFLEAYADLIEETAVFMYDFADYNADLDRYELRGIIPAQETLRAAETVNPPFELAYWHYAINVAQQWRERLGKERRADWDKLLRKLSPLAEAEGLYLAAETAPETYHDIRFTSDHMAVLAALGVLPQSPLLEPETMHRTLDWVCDNWNWDQTWGWDYPTTAMCAVRLGEPEKAIEAILMNKRTNTYLPNGHNYQDARLRCYLPGNGGLLTTVALMCAGWEGCTVENPGFPKDGIWEVRWEGINPLP